MKQKIDRQLTWWAILVVCQDAVIVDEQSGEHGTSWRAAHGRRDERIWEKSPALFKNGPSFRHVVEWAKFNVLVVRHYQDDVGLLRVCFCWRLGAGLSRAKIIIRWMATTARLGRLLLVVMTRCRGRLLPRRVDRSTRAPQSLLRDNINQIQDESMIHIRTTCVLPSGKRAGFLVGRWTVGHRA